MSTFDEKTRLMLLYPLPTEAVKPDPINKGRSTINPIYVAERLNKVFGIGGWSFDAVVESSTEFTQKTRNGERAMFRGVVNCTLRLSNGASYQTTASSSNSDEGDALKGGATDGLTKLASWLGIGSHVWKNQDYNTALALWRKEWDKFNTSEEASQQKDK